MIHLNATKVASCPQQNLELSRFPHSYAKQAMQGHVDKDFIKGEQHVNVTLMVRARLPPA